MCCTGPPQAGSRQAGPTLQDSSTVQRYSCQARGALAIWHYVHTTQPCSLNSTYIDHCTDTAIVCLVLLVSSSWVWLLLSEYRHFLQPCRVDVHWFDHYTSSHICTFGSWRIIWFPEFPLTFLSFYLRVSLHKKIDFVYIQGKKPPPW